MSGNTEKNSKHGLKRIPRPYGATTLAAQYHITKQEEARQAYTQLMIQQWLLGNGSLCGVTYDIQTLANSLHIQVDDIRVHMREQVTASRIWDKDQQEQILFGLMGQMMSCTLEDRMRVNRQIDILTRSQGDSYKPFISAELNKALKMGIESTTSIQALVQRLMGGGGTTNIFNMFQQNNHNEQNNVYVTRDQVMEIISDEQKQLPKSEQAKLLEARYDLGALPEVVATRQEGIDTSKEGLGGHINVAEMQMITDNLKGAMAAADDDHHEMRRQIEMNIDPDDEDPELDMYTEDDDDNNELEDFSSSRFLA